jgi:hypothetical protein
MKTLCGLHCLSTFQSKFQASSKIPKLSKPSISPSFQSFIDLLKASLVFAEKSLDFSKLLIEDDNTKTTQFSSQVHSVVQTEPTTVTAVLTVDQVQTAAQMVVVVHSAAPTELTISSVAQMERTIQLAVLLERQHLQPNL